jgi:hypothetical protein
MVLEAIHGTVLSTDQKMESEQNTNAHEINNLTSNQHNVTYICDMLRQFKRFFTDGSAAAFTSK